MKIGILTQPLQYNYGGLLQNFALQTVLKEAGYDCITLDWQNIYLPPESDTIQKRKALLKYYIKLALCKDISHPTNSFDSFKNKYINSTGKIKTSGGFGREVKKNKIDVLLVGSDQCWRPIYCFPFLNQMYLNFIDKESGIRKLSYAASFGSDCWEYSEKETRIASKLAKDFDFISVREYSAVKLCKCYLGVDASHVLDPTLLLPKKHYADIVENENTPTSPGDLYYYILDPTSEKTALISVIAKQLGLTPFFVERIEQRRDNNCGIAVPPSVFSWLRGFMDAEMTIVDSFHGMVFSIIFNKPFWVIGNKERGLARFQSLLKIFNLEERIITDSENTDFRNPIDWSFVNSKLSELSISSKNLLLTNIRNEKIID